MNDATTLTRREVPQLAEGDWTTDGGLETWLVFHDEIDLPDFAAFPLLDDERGREALDRYFEHYLSVAERRGTGYVIDTPTWRANADWGPRLGYDRDALIAVNERAVREARRIAARHPDVEVVVNGVIGPRGDGYVVGETMNAAEAASYHSLQARAFATAGADMITAVTMTYVDEAVGIVRAAADAGLPVVVGFTTETDGRLPSGMPLGEAVEAVDAQTGGAATSFMINCAHPTHFVDALRDGSEWVRRIGAIRANASTMSHEELDEAEELDRGDPGDLAERYVELRRLLPGLRVVGGCCGTDHEHVDAIAARLSTDAPSA